MKMHGGFAIEVEATVGTPYGYVPGHRYHDVEVAIGRRESMYRCVIVEDWGTQQGGRMREEEGRRKVVARDEDWQLALGCGHQRAGALGMRVDYLIAAIDRVREGMLDVARGSGEQTGGAA